MPSNTSDQSNKLDELEQSLLSDKSFQHILKLAPKSQKELMTFELAKYINTLLTQAEARGELKGRISEWENIDGDDTHYWDYREVGNTTEKVYLTPIERNDELEARLASLTNTEVEDDAK